MKKEERKKGVASACKVLVEINNHVRGLFRPGANFKELDQKLEEAMAKFGAESAPKEMYGFPAASCISVNSVACHGVPQDAIWKEEDVVNIDISIKYKGFFADFSRVYFFGKDSEKKKLVEFCLMVNKLAIEKVEAGGAVTDLGGIVFEECRRLGFAVVANYGGHFIGESLHLKPFVPSTISPKKLKKIDLSLVQKFEEDDCFCFEPIITTQKNGEVESATYVDVNKWDVKTFHGTACAHYENTYAIENGKVVSLTG